MIRYEVKIKSYIKRISDYNDRVTRIALFTAGQEGRRHMKTLLGKKGTARGAKKRRRKGETLEAFQARRPILVHVPSPPGQPPHKITGTLQRLVAFAVDMKDRDVVCGPMIFTTKSGRAYGGTAVPGLLDSGGTVRGRRYKARPFSTPTRDYVAGQFPRILEYAARRAR